MPPTWSKWAQGVCTLQHVFYSPNFVWLTVAILVYVIFPYNFEANAEIYKTFSAGWVLKRCAVSLFVAFAYTGFWHLSLYSWGWSTRKFKPDSWPNKSAARMAHNLWYSTLGALQWAAWECVFMNIYAHKKFPFIEDRCAARDTPCPCMPPPADACPYRRDEPSVRHNSPSWCLRAGGHSEAFATLPNILRMCFWTAFIPLWRGA